MPRVTRAACRRTAVRRTAPRKSPRSARTPAEDRLAATQPSRLRTAVADIEIRASMRHTLSWHYFRLRCVTRGTAIRDVPRAGQHVAYGCDTGPTSRQGL